MAKKIKSILVLASAVSLYANVATAYAIYGAGASSCGSYLQDRRSGSIGNYSAYISWMQGYITAFGYSNAKMRESDVNGMVVWLDNYCLTNPLSEFSDAVRAMAEKMKP